MPAITFPFNSDRFVYLEDGTRVLVPQGTLLTVRPTIFFETKASDEQFQTYVPVGDGATAPDRSSFECVEDKYELVKLDHLIHGSSAGPLAFTSLMPPEVIWELAFRTYGWEADFITTDSAQDLFIEDICFYADSREYRPLIILADGQFMLTHQVALIREKHLIVCLRIQQSFYNGERDQEPTFVVENPGLYPEITYGKTSRGEDKMRLFFKCSVWDVLLRHHRPEWSEQADGRILLHRDSGISTEATTPVFFKRATSFA